MLPAWAEKAQALYSQSGDLYERGYLPCFLVGC
jgi:hypothetical protein